MLALPLLLLNLAFVSATLDAKPGKKPPDSEQGYYASLSHHKRMNQSLRNLELTCSMGLIDEAEVERSRDPMRVRPGTRLKGESLRKWVERELRFRDWEFEDLADPDRLGIKGYQLLTKPNAEQNARLLEALTFLFRDFPPEPWLFPDDTSDFLDRPVSYLGHYWPSDISSSEGKPYLSPEAYEAFHKARIKTVRQLVSRLSRGSLKGLLPRDKADADIDYLKRLFRRAGVLR